MSVLLEAHASVAFASLAAPACFPSQVGGTTALRREAGLDAQAIAAAAQRLLRRGALGAAAVA